MNKSIPSSCFFGGGAGGGGGGSGAAPSSGGSMSSLMQQLAPPTQQSGQQGQGIQGLTMPTMGDIFGAAGQGGGSSVNAPMPETHGAANASIMKAILSLL